MAIETPFIFGNIYTTKEDGILLESANKMILVPTGTIMIPDNCYDCCRTEEFVEKLKKVIIEFNNSTFESLPK